MGTCFDIERMSDKKTEMIRRIGYLSGMGLVMGSMIGSGIFMSPGSVLASSGSVGLSLIMWTCCGVISSLGALCALELGLYFPNPAAHMFTFMRDWVICLLFFTVG